MMKYTFKADKNYSKLRYYLQSIGLSTNTIKQLSKYEGQIRQTPLFPIKPQYCNDTRYLYIIIVTCYPRLPVHEKCWLHKLYPLPTDKARNNYGGGS